MPSDFHRALDAARHTEQSRTTAEDHLARRNAEAAERGYRQMLAIGREAYRALADAGCEEFSFTDDFRNPDRVIGVGIVLDGNNWDDPVRELVVCSDGRLLVGNSSIPTVPVRRWFGRGTKEWKGLHVGGRRVRQIPRGAEVGVSVRSPANPATAASYPKDAYGHSYSVEVDVETGELLARDPDYQRRPLAEDLAAMVARVTERRHR